MTALFISDLHLDETEPTRIEAFERFVDTEVPRFDNFYILGDLVEVWVGDDDDAPFADRLRELLARAAEKSRVHLMHGNRDFLFGEAFARDTGVTLVDDPSVVDIDGRRVAIAHGDAYCTGDAPYQQMRTLFRSPDWQRDMLARSLEERRAFAAALRARSHAESANKPANIMDVTPEAVAAALQEANVDVLVHGHTHRPGIHHLGDDKRRIVLGDWNRCGWKLEMTTDEERLICFGL